MLFRKDGFDVGKYCNGDFQLNIVGENIISKIEYILFTIGISNFGLQNCLSLICVLTKTLPYRLLENLSDYIA